MTRKPPPVILSIPGDIHSRALALGLIVETYSQVIAGHGHTGRVAWSLAKPSETSPGFVELVRLRYGADSSSEHARASLRRALDEIEGA